MIIIDASVALKWFVNEANGQQSADQILNDLEKNPRLFAVPDLFFAEMLHVLCRLFKDHRKIQESLGIIENLGFERVGLGHELLQLAAEFSLHYGLSGYDSIYVATAHLLGGQWYTFDEKAHKKLSKLKISKLLT